MAAKSAEPLDSSVGRERGANPPVASRPAHYDTLVVALIALTFGTVDYERGCGSNRVVRFRVMVI